MRKLFLPIIIFVSVAIVAGTYLTGTVRAAGPSFTLYPSTGFALLGQNFSIDIMLDTGSEDTTLAAAVFRFNPDKVRVVRAEYGDLYCQYPEDQYTVDNTLGWVKITGYCTDPAYGSSGYAELFGRITFVPLIEGPTAFEFVESYSDTEWESKMMVDGSPPSEISGISYSGGTYTVVSSIDQSGVVDGGGNLPGVGLIDNTVVMYGLGLLFIAGIVFVGERVFRSARNRTSGGKDRIIVK